MDFIFLNVQEISALRGLPYMQQLAYVFGIRPYMDRTSFVVGIKRGISYQSLSETLYIEPHPGIKSGSPSREQIRRVIKGLERAGLIEIQSSDKRLILKCLIANTNYSVQNKPDINQTQETDTFISYHHISKSHQANISQIAKADTPHNSEKNHVCVNAQFEKFWSLYPKKTSKQKAWEEFQKLEPSNALVTQILTALQQQLDAIIRLQSQGQWVPKWKLPANWLTQRCWEDEIDFNMENQHAVPTASYSAKPSIDPFWEACKSGAQRAINSIQSRRS